MINRILFAPDSSVAIAPGSPSPALSAPAAAPKPATTPPPAAKPSTPPAAAPAAPAAKVEPKQEPSDDPFAPPSKPAGGAPADNKGGNAPVSFDSMAPKELRERVKTLNQENQNFAGKIKSYEDKIKELDAKGIDTTAMTARLTAIEQERDKALAELRAAKQEASPEFKEKFDKPFNSAAERARKNIVELSVTDAEGNQRPATWADFTALYSLPIGKAIEQANAMFGGAAQFVLQQREKLQDLDTARATALEEEKAQFKERSAKEIAEQAVKRQGVGKLWEDTNKRLSETNDDYKVDATDSEAADARKHALAVFDGQINAADNDDFVKQKVLKDAHIRQKVGAYAVQKVQIARLKSEKEALQAQIDELKGAGPGKTIRPGGAPETGDDGLSWEEALLKAVPNS